jgi:hypothetical protein
MREKMIAGMRGKLPTEATLEKMRQAQQRRFSTPERQAQLRRATEVVISKHRQTPPPWLRMLVPEVPAEVEQVVLIALAKDPRDRFGSVRAFATALGHASQGGEPRIVLPPTGEARSAPDVPLHAPAAAPAPLGGAPAAASPAIPHRRRTGLVAFPSLLLVLLLVGGSLEHRSGIPWHVVRIVA